MNKKKGFTIYINKETYDCFKQYIQNRGMTINGFIRLAINEAIKDECEKSESHN